MTRTRRRITGLLGIAALLFAQLAVSVHACPKQAEAALPAEAHASMPCEEMAAADTSLCQKHCSGSEQVQGSGPVVPATFAPAFVATVDLPVLAHGAVPPADPALLHATSPPPTIRNCCFRI